MRRIKWAKKQTLHKQKKNNIICSITFSSRNAGFHTFSCNSWRYIGVKHPTYDMKHAIKSISPGSFSIWNRNLWKISLIYQQQQNKHQMNGMRRQNEMVERKAQINRNYRLKFYFSTDWCQRIASQPSPVTKRPAKLIVNAVRSASNSKFVFSVMAVLNSFWIEFKRDSIPFQREKELNPKKMVNEPIYFTVSENTTRFLKTKTIQICNARTKILLFRKSSLSCAALSSFCASSKARCFGSTILWILWKLCMLITHSHSPEAATDFARIKFGSNSGS